MATRRRWISVSVMDRSGDGGGNPHKMAYFLLLYSKPANTSDVLCTPSPFRNFLVKWENSKVTHFRLYLKADPPGALMFFTFRDGGHNNVEGKKRQRIIVSVFQSYTW